MEQNFENWEALPSSEADEAELKQIRKILNRRNWKTVCISVAVAITLILACVYGILPLVEKCYPDPYSSHLADSLEAYVELTQPGKTLTMSYGKTGFASYDLFLRRIDTASGEKEILRGSLETGKLSLDLPFYDREVTEAYLWSGSVLPQEIWVQQQEQTETMLRELPEYITVEAAAWFSEDLTMEQLVELEYGYGESAVDIQWLAIRCCEQSQEDQMPMLGFSTQYGGHRDLNDQYPQLNFDGFEEDGSHMEMHFKSLLQFSQDQAEQGLGVSYTNKDGSIYQTALDYVEQQGVKTYACLVSGSPSAILQLLENGDVGSLKLTDGWVDLG